VHPDHLLRHLTAAQLADWRAYDRIEPIGGYRADYRVAQVCHWLFQSIQAQRGDGKHVKSTPWDFMPWGPDEGGKGPEDKPQTVEEMKAIIMGIPGVKVKKREKG
jgi:hypothetical protein